MPPDRLLAALRAGGERAATARAALAHASDPSALAAPAAAADQHVAARASVTAALIASLQPADHAVARWLLEQEVAAHAAAGQGASETLYSLVAAVARFGDPQDALLLWYAHDATPDTRAGVDVEQLARAGVERVRARLRELTAAGGRRSASAARALAWFDDGIVGGALDDLAAYFAWSDERFGLTLHAPV
ncbi:MAG TPA: hypothetical protein VIG30_02705 [Ktedonobacterales bacterium]|jgi:hypothetical protein